jgi:nicotinate-nucleotide--dimethylbenzimidazole phosphoribosyltransferase
MNTLEEVCRQIKPVDAHWLTAARLRHLSLTKPPGSLGHLEEIGVRIAAIAETETPSIPKKRIYVAAADHGVTDEGVSAYPREVTHQMVVNFLRGGAAINVLARHCGIEIEVVDAGVDHDFPDSPGLLSRKIIRGTHNMTEGAAMSLNHALQAISTGIDLAGIAKQDGIRLVGIGEMGIGNTTAASAITASLTGAEIDVVTGRGTGVDDEMLDRKRRAIRTALKVNQPGGRDPIDILRKVGGLEIGVLMGIVVGCAAGRIAVVADGFISTAAAALAVAACADIRDYLFIAHLSAEPGHRALLEFIGGRPILDLGMRLGEGTGAALAMHLIEASSRILSEMATFQEAGVTNKEV